ncbi:MAG: hypothetical protein JWN45_145 [Acidobacteriaceae bacterium]|nr:hypothetical protein [Acidobacteriaceae bacterium]
MGTLLAEWKIASKHTYPCRRKRFCQCDQQRRIAVPSSTVREHQPRRRLCRRMKKAAYRLFAGSEVRERLWGSTDHDNIMDDGSSLWVSDNLSYTVARSGKLAVPRRRCA